MIGNNKKPAWYLNSLRTLFSIFDKVVFWLLVLVYQVFFRVASATILKPSTVRDFFGRIQLILGIIIMFRLIMSLINGILDPDSITDKNKGFSKIIARVIIALTMLVLVMPVNIPNATNSYQKQINTHGILFGTLYEFQSRVIKSNTIGKLILGSGYNATNSNADEPSEEESMKASANLMASVIVKSFVRINLKSHTEEQDAELDINNWKCDPSTFTDNADEVMENYTKQYSDPQYILDNINDDCGKYYIFNYTVFLGALVGGIITFILIGFTIDVAVRTIKLEILRLIAPIPIISYIDPKSEKDGAFNSWIKTLMSTYADLFLRLIIIYFAVFMVEEISINGIAMDFGDHSMVNTLAIVFIFIGIFMFAKKAPDFLKQMLGIQGESKGFFNGLGKMAGVGALVGGAVGGAAVLGGKKLVAGADSAFHGKGFLNGTKNAQGNGKISKAIQGFNNLTPHRMDQQKSIKEARENQSLRDKEMNLGKSLWNKAANNDFSNLSEINGQYMDSYNDVKNAKNKFHSAENELTFAEANLNAAQQNGGNVAAAQQKLIDAKKALGTADSRYKLAQANHEDMKKIHPKDAQKEEAFDLYDKTLGPIQQQNNQQQNNQQQNNQQQNNQQQNNQQQNNQQQNNQQQNNQQQNNQQQNNQQQNNQQQNNQQPPNP